METWKYTSINSVLSAARFPDSSRYFDQLYLTIGQIFVGFYGVIALLMPQAFMGLGAAGTPKFASDLIYFSFATLTTVGYGDILPVHPLARSLSNLEAIIGQLYPATLLARLVTLELEDRRR